MEAIETLVFWSQEDNAYVAISPSRYPSLSFLDNDPVIAQMGLIRIIFETVDVDLEKVTWN